MSILLEALRKSEKSQSPVESPTIHTDQHISMPSEPVSKGPLAVLLLLVLLLIAWIVWRQYESPVVNDQPPQAAPARQDDAIETPVSSLPSKDVASSSAVSSGEPSSTRRTPVESYQAETPASSTTSSSTSASSQPGTPNPGTAQPDTSRPQPAASAGADRRAGSGLDQQAAVSDAAQAKHPQPISYWELPDAIRADVPEIKFSVLVYANQPADRFVLVNGQRLVEGDSYGEGLVVAEIRRDGVVFSFRLYRFLVEK